MCTRGRLIDGMYTIVNVHAKIEISNTKYSKDEGEISNCPRLSFLYHVFCTDTQETYVMECNQETMINIAGDIWKQENANFTAAMNQNVIIPSVTYGEFLNSANRSVYKGRLNVPPRKGPCLVAVLLNGQHMAGSPIKLMSSPGFACAELSYAEKMFKGKQFL